LSWKRVSAVDCGSRCHAEADYAVRITKCFPSLLDFLIWKICLCLLNALHGYHANVVCLTFIGNY